MKTLLFMMLVVVFAVSALLAPIAIIEYHCYAVRFHGVCGGSAFLTLSESCGRTITAWIWIPASIAGTDVDVWIPCVGTREWRP